MSLTFIIPALNESAVIGRCVASIVQEVPSASIIVVDNGSEDDTANIAKEAGATVVVEPRRGLNYARRAGLDLADSSWIAFIDAENEIPPGWYARLGYLVLVTPGVVLVSGPPVYRELSWLTRVSIGFYYRVGRQLHRVMPMCQGGNFVAWRDAFNAAGGFDLSVEFYGEDTATARRMALQGRVVFDLHMWCWSDARRLIADGVVVAGARYALNYLWMSLLDRPFTSSHVDHRA